MKHEIQFLRVTEGTGRLEAFSDGVIAISITLLALNLPVPHLNTAIGEPLAPALLHQWPQYLSFFISFLNVGIVWANHHEMFRFIKRSNHIFLLINVFLLMSLTVIPYSTAVLGEYLKEHNNQVTATAFYSATLFFMGLMVNAVWQYAVRNKFIDEQCNPEVISFMSRSYLLSPLLRGLAFILAFIWYPAALAVHLLTTIVFLLPTTKRPIYLPHKDHPA